VSPRDDGRPLGGKVIPLPGFGPTPSPPREPPVPPGEELSFLERDDEVLPPPEPAVLAAAAEAVLFTAGDPIPFSRLRDLLSGPEEDDLRAALTLVQTRYARAGHGLRLVEIAGGWQLRTHPRYARWCARARAVKPLRLSRAALETLAIVAYEQPVTRAEVEQLRGVDPGAILRMLVERGVVRTLGHQNSPGRPLLYGTTPRFLEIFGLRDLGDLPTLKDLRELKEDDPQAELVSDLLDEDELSLTEAPPLIGEE
jgi:segregation and condensation protein B